MSRKHLTDSELDALVVRSLSRLPPYAPSRCFADRVMNRVQLPSPRPVVVYRRARDWLVQPRRALALAGAYAVFAVTALAISVPWLVSNSPGIAFAVEWTLGRGTLLLRDLALAITGWTLKSGLAGTISSLPLSGPRVWALAGGAVAAYAGCAIGLHYLLRAPRPKHAPVQIQA